MVLAGWGWVGYPEARRRYSMRRKGSPMSLLDQPEAQALLNDAVLTPEAVAGCADHLTGFLQRYLPHFYRSEQRHNAPRVIRGLPSALERKPGEPIAIEAGLPRKPIQ